MPYKHRIGCTNPDRANAHLWHRYCKLSWDQPLWSPRRIVIALLKFGWWSEEDRTIADQIGLWTFIQYEGRPEAQCRETGHFCG